MNYLRTMSDEPQTPVADPFAPPKKKGHRKPKSKPSDGFDHSAATSIFVWGLLAMVACQLAGPVAWVLGARYKKECEQHDVRPDGLGVAGYILGISATALMGLSIVVFFSVFFLMLALD